MGLCNRKRHQLLRNQLMRWRSQNRRVICSETYLAVFCRIHANRIGIVNVLKCAVTWVSKKCVVHQGWESLTPNRKWYRYVSHWDGLMMVYQEVVLMQIYTNIL